MNCNNHSDMRSIVLLINHRERTIFIRTIWCATRQEDNEK